MEALAAVSLGGNIIQFTQFATTLLNSTRKLHHNYSEGGSEQDHMREICYQLNCFSKSLSQTTTNDRATDSTANDGVVACARACLKDCQELSSVLKGLQKKSGSKPRVWYSFRSALAEYWKTPEIDALRTRLADHERAMILRLCQDSSTGIQWLRNRIDGFLPIGESRDSMDYSRSRLLGPLMQRHDYMQKDLDKLTSQVDEGMPVTADVIDDFRRLISAFAGEMDKLELQVVLDSLDYEDRPMRHENIKEAHEKTYRWGLSLTQEKQDDNDEWEDYDEDEDEVDDKEDDACDNDDASPSSGNLYTWLTSSEGQFWVSGRPGSGKSTFMKFVADHPNTLERLSEWAKPKPLIFAAHYFTIYGTEIQKSLNGLLRSLSFEILQACPELIDVFVSKTNQGRWRQKTWATKDLQSALKAISKDRNSPVKICFFIDGLDEYDGDHLEMCQMVQEMSKSPHIKFCLASRQWNVFEDAFGDDPKLKIYMHDLTRRDILSFARARLQEHPRWRALVGEGNVEYGNDLVQKVVQKANGVFLWVFLVTRLLREGLTNDDTMPDLMRRFESCPSDLDEFFKRIMESVDSFYHEQMAAYLQIAVQAKKPLGILVYHFIDEVLVDGGYAFHASEKEEILRSQRKAVLESKLRRRLNARCKGLLEHNKDRVEFLHRTVYDYLRSGVANTLLVTRSPPGFCPRTVLIQASVALLRRSTFNADRSTADAIIEICEYRRDNSPSEEQLLRSEGSYQRPLGLWFPTLLESLDRHLQAMVARGQFEFDSSLGSIRRVYRRSLLDQGVTPNFAKKLQSPDYFQGMYFSEPWSPLPMIMDQAVVHDCLGQSLVETTKELLREGHDPHQPYYMLLSALISYPSRLEKTLNLGIIQQLLDTAATGIPAKQKHERLMVPQTTLSSTNLLLLLATVLPSSCWDVYESILRRTVQPIDSTDLKVERLVQCAQSDGAKQTNPEYDEVEDGDRPNEGPRPEDPCWIQPFLKGHSLLNTFDTTDDFETGYGRNYPYPVMFVLATYASIWYRLKWSADGKHPLISWKARECSFGRLILRVFPESQLREMTGRIAAYDEATSEDEEATVHLDVDEHEEEVSPITPDFLGFESVGPLHASKDETNMAAFADAGTFSVGGPFSNRFAWKPVS